MLFNSVATFSVVLALSAHVNAHAVFNPFIGKPEGTLATRNDAGQGGACGKGNPADITPNKQKLNGKQDAFATATGANGAFKFTGEAFNGGRDGSTKVTMQIDTTGTGKNFQAIGTVTTNGDDPGKPGARVNLAAELGAGTKCTAGPDKNRCLVQVTGAGGFRSCIVVQQAGGGGGGAAAPPPAQNQNNNNNNNQNNNNQNNNNQNNNNQNNNNQNNQNNNSQNNNNQGGMTLVQKAAQKVQNGKNAVKAVINKGKNAVKQAVNNTGNKLLQLAKTAKGFVLRPFSMNNVPKGGQVITINKDTGAVEVVKNQKRGMLLPGGRRAFLDRED